MDQNVTNSRRGADSQELRRPVIGLVTVCAAETRQQLHRHSRVLQQDHLNTVGDRKGRQFVPGSLQQARHAPSMSHLCLAVLCCCGSARVQLQAAGGLPKRAGHDLHRSLHFQPTGCQDGLDRCQHRKVLPDSPCSSRGQQDRACRHDSQCSRRARNRKTQHHPNVGDEIREDLVDCGSVCAKEHAARGCLHFRRRSGSIKGRREAVCAREGS